ncbi:MAG: hypothetical protein ABR911_05180 [Syntrophales bacterium]
MKKLWIVLLSVALIMAFTLPVSAADVKFSGSYVAQGYYDNNRVLMKEGGSSVMNTWQRLRIQTDFQVQEGLKLTTKFDAMEKIWGASRSATYPTSYSSIGVQNTGSGEAENIKFREAYVTANLWGGILRVGYQQQNQWGTSFADYGDYGYGARIRYDYVVGPWTFLALYDKVEGTQYYAPAGPAGNVGVATYQVDQETDKYSLAFIYNWGKGNTGLLFQYVNDSTGSMAGYLGQTPNPATDLGYKRQWYAFLPYVKAQLGPVYVEAEVVYLAGKTRKYDTAGNGTDRTKDGLSGYASATVDFAPMYAGLTLVFVAGDDLSTNDKDEAGFPGVTDFNPLLILWNYDLQRWNGAIGPNGGISMASGIMNAQVAQVFVGVKPIPKLDVKASYAIAQADKDGAATGWQSKNYGSELDITATYKIYDNLSYMVGFAYLWAGDYFKGTNAGVQIDNDYLVTHKLTLTF